MLPAFSPDEMDQLKRAAQMFEMILDTGAQSDEAYETLKDVYAKLCMPDELKRVTARFADYLLARGERERGIAQLSELAARYPDEPQWRERLAELGAPPPAPSAPAAEQESPEPVEGTCPERVEGEGPPAEEQLVNDAAQPERAADDPPEPVDREAVQAFNQLKAMAEFRALEKLRGSAEDDLDYAIGEAEKILCDLDQPSSEEVLEPESAEAALEGEEHEEAVPHEEPMLEPVESGFEPVPETLAEPVATTAAAPGETAVEAEPRTSPERLEAKPHANVAGELGRVFQQSLRLGEMLVEQGVITRDNLETALERQRESDKRIGQVLIELGYATEADVLNCLAQQAGVPYLPLALYEVQPEAAALLPESFVRKHRVVPVDVIANSVLVTIAAPLTAEARAELESLLGERRANYYISAQSEIDKKIEELYPRP